MTSPQTRWCSVAFVLGVPVAAMRTGARTNPSPRYAWASPSTSTPQTVSTETTAPREAQPAIKKPSRPAASRPPIKQWPIPFPASRGRETEAYTQRHYGVARDKPDVELKELPGLCSHFIVDRDDTIYQLVPLAKGLPTPGRPQRCRRQCRARRRFRPRGARQQSAARLIAQTDGLASLPVRHRGQRCDRPLREPLVTAPSRAGGGSQDADTPGLPAWVDGQVPLEAEIALVLI